MIFYNYEHTRFSAISNISSKTYIPGCTEILGVDVINGIFVDFASVSESTLFSLMMGAGISAPSTVLDARFRSQNSGNLKKLFEICNVEEMLPDEVDFNIR